IPEQCCDIGAIETFDFADTGWRRDIDLGHIIADHIDADQNEAALAERRADALADFTLARRKLALFRTATGVHVGARIRFRWHAIDRANRLAINQDDTLVAGAHVLEIA